MSIRSNSGRTYKNALEKWKSTKEAAKNWAINNRMKSGSSKNARINGKTAKTKLR